MKVYYVYVDFDLAGKAFYTGKGQAQRIGASWRGQEHVDRFLKLSGFTRRIIMQTTDEEVAFDYEDTLMEAFRTHWKYGEGGLNKRFIREEDVTEECLIQAIAELVNEHNSIKVL